MNTPHSFFPGLAIAGVAALTLPAGAGASTVSFESMFDVSDTIEGSTSGLAAADTLDISFDSERLPFTAASLPRFDPSLGRLDSITIDVVFDRSEVTLPVSFSDAGGGATTASLDTFTLSRGLVFGINTGLIRPQVIESTAQTLDLNDLTTNNLLTNVSPSQVQIDIPTDGAAGFTPSGDLLFPSGEDITGIDADGTPSSFSFLGTDEFGFVFRRVNELAIGLDQDNLDVNVTGGRIEYSGTVSVTYGFTVPEPASLALLGSGSLLLISRRRRAS